MSTVARRAEADVTDRGTLAAPVLSTRKLRNRRAAIIGSVGVPARYGGFETLAEQLAIAAEARGIAAQLTIWCSAKGTHGARPTEFRGARLRHLPLSANGASSIAYDGASAFAEMIGPGAADSVLALGVSGGGPLAALAPLSRTRLILNVDGREAQRAKWGGVARHVLAWSERRAGGAPTPSLPTTPPSPAKSPRPTAASPR
jgi:hypothetical protein